MPKPLTKAEIITAGDIGTLSTSLLYKGFVHSLPTQLLLRAHSRVELKHLENPKSKNLQIAHTNLFLEMELREIEHFDTDPNFFTPSNTKWPFELEFDEIYEDERVVRFKKKLTVINNNKKAKRITSSKRRTRKTQRFKRTYEITNEPRTTLYTFKHRRRSRRRSYTLRDSPTKATIKSRDWMGEWLWLFRYEFGLTQRIFKNKAIVTWSIQPSSGNIPIANGPRPRKQHWYQFIFPPIGAYQRFMQRTLIAFYRRQAPPWAVQEWDIRLTATTPGGDVITEKRNYIRRWINPY